MGSPPRPAAWFRPLLLAAAAVPALFGGPALAQTVAGEGSPWPSWTRDWSPLRPLVELGSEMPEAPEGAALLTAPGPRVGLFWTAGNPAALAGEVRASWTGFASGRTTREGDYRRPLDPVSRDEDRLTGQGWGPVGDWGAAAGEVSVGRTFVDPNAHANVLAPYRGSPWVLTDTALADLRRIDARVEGLLGVGLGRWALGLGGGYSSTDNRTRETGFPRLGRHAAYAVSAGALRELGDGSLRLGVHGRYRGEAETVSLVALEEASRVHVLKGYQEPSPLDLVPLSSLFRRAERDELAVGVGVAAGDASGFAWVLSAERAWGEETQIAASRAQPDDPFDRWKTGSWAVSGAAQRPLGGRWLVTAEAGWRRGEGEGRLPDFEEVVFRAVGTGVRVSAEARLRPEEAPFAAALRAELDVQRREQVDRLVEVASDLRLWRPGVGLDVARRLGDRFALEAGYGIALHRPTGTLPPEDEFGPVARGLVWRELALAATPATAHAIRWAARWQAGGGVGVWLRGDYRTASPGTPAAAGLDLSGRRTGWTALLGVTIE